ncbi:MAG: PhoPQ-activated protein PqaA family protein [Armatimonadota bacterium]|nr:PhoPQ-activated pathogenicity-related family protein [Armatimonadota bacterium]MCX7778381.1 PhoPQ-activated pathogenicity-related family protein [Armatimonadota bacterium]MDW8026545.1 PhoPQ-activated protein PqaA family protein [Armatimonadota bacterium]
MKLSVCKCWWLYSTLIACGVAQGVAICDLFSYVQRHEKCFKWELKEAVEAGGVKIFRLHMVSQEWQGIKWEHGLNVYVPASLKHPHMAGLFITGGRVSNNDDNYGKIISTFMGAPLVFLYDIPNQPLFGGLREDDLIAHTFSEYLKTGDETLPLLLPMVKSAIKAMDAVQAFLKDKLGIELKGFVLTGASKRGWTTWLTAACDERVKGIVPIVFDNLNFVAQMPYQLKMFGRYSEMIEEYTRRGLMEQMNTERGKRLVQLVDPYFYRHRFIMPKLIVNATNDRYWAVDALKFYWDELPGEKWALYVPNAGHSLEGQYERVIAALVAFFHHIAGGAPFPKMKWRFDDAKGKLTLRFSSEPKPTGVTIWVAKSSITDFRDAKWVPQAAALQGEEYIGTIEVPANGYVAMLAEAQFNIQGIGFSLTTTIRLAPEVR